MRRTLMAITVLLGLVSPPAPLAAGQGIFYIVYFDIWSSTHPDKETVIVGSRATYSKSFMVGGNYHHYNWFRDRDFWCFGETLGANSAFINQNASQFGEIRNRGFTSVCDRFNGCEAIESCWSCPQVAETNEYTGFARANVVIEVSTSINPLIITDQSQGKKKNGRGLCGFSSPILIDLNGESIQLSAPSVYFDIDDDGEDEFVAWTHVGTGEAFLALDRDRNGMVDNGAELFGNFTPLLDGSRAEHGFEALAEFDLRENGGNGDGLITELDDVFADLLLWSDTNQDGATNSSEVRAASERGLVSIDLSYVESRRRDRHGNQFRYNSQTRVMVDGRITVRMASDVFLRTLD